MRKADRKKINGFRIFNDHNNNSQWMDGELLDVTRFIKIEDG